MGKIGFGVIHKPCGHGRRRKVSQIETVAKKVDWPKIWLIIKNRQFLPNQPHIEAILPTHELVIFTKFHNN